MIGIRNLHIRCAGNHGTAFLMDSATPQKARGMDEFYDLQQDLTSIMALTNAANNIDNRFYAAKILGTYSYNQKGDWYCKDRCSAALAIQGIEFRYTEDEYYEPGWMEGAEILANHFLHSRQCQGSSKVAKLNLVAIGNGQIEVGNATACK